MTEENPAMALEAIDALRELMRAGASEPTRAAAAKILLDRFAPRKSDEEQKNEEEERQRALAEARGLLADFALVKLAYHRLQNEMAQAGEAGTDHA
ncbi:MAG: hypothetical protein PHE27_02560 [Alphaproteobacteria bacterium]|nr:hypothetical protein [Alphaproteobacteria bacterium]